MGLYTHEELSAYVAQAPTNATGTPAARPARLLAITATNRNASARYLWLFDSTSSTAGSCAYGPFLIPAGGIIGVGYDIFGKSGVYFATGLTWGISSSSSTYTQATGSECDVFAMYR